MRMLAATLLLLAGTPAAAQYRTDVPEVLGSRSAGLGRSGEQAGAFRVAYQRAGAPRIALYWNRVLSDEGESRYADRLSIRRRTEAATAGGYVGHGINAAAGVRTDDVEATSGRVRLDGPARESMDEADDWRVGSAFNAALQSAGVRLIDRSVSMRTTARASRSGRDPQAVEMDALANKAELLMEVLQTPDDQSPIGYSFRVEVKEVRTGRVLATIFEDGSGVRNAPRRFVAGPAGFEREASQAIGPDDLGRTIARDVMAAMATRWN